MLLHLSKLERATLIAQRKSKFSWQTFSYLTGIVRHRKFSSIISCIACTTLKSLALVDWRGANDTISQKNLYAGIPSLARMTQLTSLDLTGSAVNNHTLQPLGSLHLHTIVYC